MLRIKTFRSSEDPKARSSEELQVCAEDEAKAKHGVLIAVVDNYSGRRSYGITYT